ncbi:MAG TPA: type ISP restriction/modification enzyme [Pyrinomonadaceae bacterium]|nr:type ISP restriction/modification enzyme [Pyrinomonadaceae bacterium]
MAKIFYARVDEFWRREEKYAYLEERQHVGGVEWQELQPDAKHNWLTGELKPEFESFVPVGTKEAKKAKGVESKVIFVLYSYGVLTGRDSWVYAFSRDSLQRNVEHLVDLYNTSLNLWERKGQGSDPRKFLLEQNPHMKWTHRLLEAVGNHHTLEVKHASFRNGLYRPFTKQHLYFNRELNERVYVLPSIFPTPKTEEENRGIWIKTGSEWPMFALAVNVIPDALPQGGSQCFPFYTYDEDGANRRENVTDWALEKFRAQYGDASVSKWDIFHYVYALLHHPLYRERYAANLKRELPRLPFAPDFRAFAEAGAQLAELHVNYESQPEYPLERAEQPGAALDWRVERMKLSKDRRSLVYNDFLTLSGIPAEAFEYRLGNRSALEWVVDQYRTTTDPRSGITNDPNRADDPQYIVRLVGQVVHVSVETVKLVRNLAARELLPAAGV